MNDRYTSAETKVTAGSTEIEMHAHDTGKDFARPSIGAVGCRGRVRNPASVRVFGGEGTFYFGGEEGETVSAGEDGALPVPKGAVYDYGRRARLFYEQDFDVCYGDPWE